MKARELIEALHVAEKLKNNTRHCHTSSGRHESVAEHCWRSALMAMWMAAEFPEADMNKVLKMLLIHDLGEAFTGDIPTFEKTAADEETEARRLSAWVESLPEKESADMAALYAEMEARETVEAKIYKAIDGMEALLQHNESELSTWLPLEYDLQKTYAWERVEFSPYLKEVREALLEDTETKIACGKADGMV